MDGIKYMFIKLGLCLSMLCSVILPILLGINWLSNFHFASIVVEVVVFILWLLMLLVQYPLTRLRNKYRDIVEYDENGISRRYGNFSELNNQQRRQIEEQKLLQRELLIDSATLKMITKKGSAHPEAELESLVGLENVKTEMHKMAAKLSFQKEVNRHRHKKSYIQTVDADSSYHMCFMGRPGTGKSTVARIMSGFLYRYGIIRKNQYIEVDGNFFNGNSYGESTDKVKYILGQARGGVLFIDEAYALLNGMESQEVIATIVATMENNRNDLVIIFAGYDQEMKQLINSNTGLQSRIKYYFDFEDYSLDELWVIFLKMAASKQFTVNPDAKDNFTAQMITEMKHPNYGNARTVRTVLDRAIDMHSLNYVDGKLELEQKMMIVPMDLPAGKGIRISNTPADAIDIS